jgi:hypothetical protein
LDRAAIGQFVWRRVDLLHELEHECAYCWGVR